MGELEIFSIRKNNKQKTINQKQHYLRNSISQAIAPIYLERKVRTAKGNTPVKRRLPVKGQEKVPQKITVLMQIRMRVKM